MFLTDDLYAEPGQGPTAAVHLGHHHGSMGSLLVAVRAASSRARASRTSGFAAPTPRSCRLMAAYGAANLVQDFWHEQVVKRGWTSWDIPSALVPKVSVMWGLIVAATVILYALGFARRAEEAATGDTSGR